MKAAAVDCHADCHAVCCGRTVRRHRNTSVVTPKGLPPQRRIRQPTPRVASCAASGVEPSLSDEGAAPSPSGDSGGDGGDEGAPEPVFANSMSALTAPSMSLSADATASCAGGGGA